jgi:hypothetical protein
VIPTVRSETDGRDYIYGRGRMRAGGGGASADRRARGISDRGGEPLIERAQR